MLGSVVFCYLNEPNIIYSQRDFVESSSVIAYKDDNDIVHVYACGSFSCPFDNVLGIPSIPPENAKLIVTSPDDFCFEVYFGSYQIPIDESDSVLLAEISSIYRSAQSYALSALESYGFTVSLDCVIQMYLENKFLIDKNIPMIATLPQCVLSSWFTTGESHVYQLSFLFEQKIYPCMECDIA